MTERWVQLDDDAELEAVLVVEGNSERLYGGYVFDHGKTWNLVGVFLSQQHHSDINSLLTVVRIGLVSSGPPLLVHHRGLGGSASVVDTITVLHLRQGRLWPILEVTAHEVNMLSPSFESRTQVFGNHSRDRIVIETEETEEGKSATYTCEVRLWDTKQFTFVDVPADHRRYCDPNTGRRLPDSATDLPLSAPTICQSCPLSSSLSPRSNRSRSSRSNPDPHQIALTLRDRGHSIPESDCRVLDLGECEPTEPGRSQDVTERWAQLDDDRELEAILITDAGSRWSYGAYVFDHGKTWNVVGAFLSRQHRGKIDSLLKVLDPGLTAHTPRFLIWPMGPRRQPHLSP